MRQIKELRKEHIVDDYFCDNVAFLHAACTLGSSDRERFKNEKPLWERIKIHEHEGSKRADRVLPELAADIADFLCIDMDIESALTESKIAEHWLEEHDAKFEYMVLDALDYLKTRKMKVQDKSSFFSPSLREQWKHVFEIVSSPYTYSSSIHDLETPAESSLRLLKSIGSR